MKSYNRSTVFITGASYGIGEAFARNLAERGANLVLTARSEDKLKTIAEQLSNNYHIKCNVFPSDLTQPDAPKILFDEIKVAGISVDLLINNAGFGRWGNFFDYSIQEYIKMIDLNIKSLVDLTYLFLPAMVEKKSGGVINVASTAAFQPIPYGPVYVASKSFVLNFSESLWGEFRKHGVTIMALCPGTTETNFFNVAIPDADERNHRLKKIPKAETPEKVVERALNGFLKGKNYLISGKKNYLLAQLARFVTRRSAIKIAGSFFEPDH